MTNKDNIQSLICGSIGSAISFAGCSAQTLEDMDHIFSIVCGIIGVVITVVTCIVIPVIRKIRAAKSDGTITKDEVKDIIDTIDKGIDEVKDEVDKHK